MFSIPFEATSLAHSTALKSGTRQQKQRLAKWEMAQCFQWYSAANFDFFSSLMIKDAAYIVAECYYDPCIFKRRALAVAAGSWSVQLFDIDGNSSWLWLSEFKCKWKFNHTTIGWQKNSAFFRKSLADFHTWLVRLSSFRLNTTSKYFFSHLTRFPLNMFGTDWKRGFGEEMYNESQWASHCSSGGIRKYSTKCYHALITSMPHNCRCQRGRKRR